MVRLPAPSEMSEIAGRARSRYPDDSRDDASQRATKPEAECSAKPAMSPVVKREASTVPSWS